MLIEQQTITSGDIFAGDAAEAVVRYSTLRGFSVEGGHFDASFLFCTFVDLELYWGLFNLCVFVECTFENCTFRGTGFPGCRFVACSFVNCHFVKDNLNGECFFDDTKWHDCKQSNTEGLEKYIPVEA
jgi:uncharacterized protein YjbI with pentapeptide repeats